jgi:hypothetical protein
MLVQIQGNIKVPKIAGGQVQMQGEHTGSQDSVDVV